MARELGIDLAEVGATGPKGRITKQDLLAFLKGPAQAPAAAPAAAAGAGIPEIPAQDFSKFGPVESKPLSRIKKVSGPFLHRSWLNVPHVTHHDEADITELDRYRKELDTAAKAEKDPYRVTLLAFLVKACVAALKKFPEFNSSLAPEKDSLILKGYYNIGIAVDTPDGLVVPVVKDADRKGIIELSREFGSISAKARDGKLAPGDMQGGTFTISSLGGIGGTGFTPIVNAPGGRHPRCGPVGHEAGLERHGVRAAQHPAARGVLRPPGDRRCARRPVRPAPLPSARGRPEAAAVTSQRPTRRSRFRTSATSPTYR